MIQYPKKLKLKTGEEVIIRLMQEDDEQNLLKFFKAIPDEDRRMLRDDTTDPVVIRRWTSDLDYERVFPLIAEYSGMIVGTATLHMSTYGWQRHIGEIRCVIAKDFRGKGVGKLLMHELTAKAAGRGLNHIQLSLIDTQTSQIKIFERLGFRKVAILPKYVLDVTGNEHDLLIMTSKVSDIWKKMEDLIQESEIDTIRSMQ
jgi:L-amino acid N-acyltransferase YncA